MRKYSSLNKTGVIFCLFAAVILVFPCELWASGPGPEGNVPVAEAEWIPWAHKVGKDWGEGALKSLGIPRRVLVLTDSPSIPGLQNVPLDTDEIAALGFLEIAKIVEPKNPVPTPPLSEKVKLGAFSAALKSPKGPDTLLYFPARISEPVAFYRLEGGSLKQFHRAERPSQMTGVLDFYRWFLRELGYDGAIVEQKKIVLQLSVLNSF